ncbi:MAG: CDP-glycerol glycerophosphotransferase family protein, partial [Bacilli bacterium]|nr:CDP-glycerol glycerophosphotransferase family protein [Bacilli bacterium]
NATIVKYGGKQYYEYYSKAKYWVTNSRLPEHIIKKPEQVYVQCWHGTPLKRLGYDILAETQNAMNTQEEMIEKYNSDAIRYSYMLSPSKFCTEKFTSAFNLNELHTTNIIIEEGYPRNDYLYNYKEEDITRIKEELGIPENKKIVLYAPTWRDNQHTSGVGYTYKTEADFDYLKEKLEDDYVILFRAHYFIANSFDFEKYEGFVYDVSKIDDINELYVISDILITDYSSVFFDYANLKRPMLFFMYDLEFYENKLRGFYIDLKELPGDIIKEEVDIVNIIQNIGDYNKKHAKTYKKFNEKYNYLDDRQASKRVLTKIVNE